ncbi:MAG: PD-(D/E)XK nuclease family protein [candidate division Zixibacteria bacterium]|nr:PD-(D/E)XK nuclease family protein [candidate division Zixibacteria bacterium]
MKKYSYSTLDTFNKCPLKFKYKKLERAEALLEESVEAFLGTRVHQSLKKLYDDLMMVKTLSLDELLEYYNSQWERNWSESIKIRKKEYDLEHYRKTGERCITNYYQRYSPFDKDKTLGLEMKIDISLDSSGKYGLEGVIDRVTQLPNGKYEIHDYKTAIRGGNCPSQVEMDSDKQLALYQIGLIQRWKDVKEVDLVYHYLAFDKDFRTHRTKEELENLKKETTELMDEIEQARIENNFPARVSALCEWCEYRHICPEQKHLYLVESLPINEYLKDDGVQLVNQYIQLKDQETSLKSEIENLKEIIFQFAEKENLKAIKGSEYKLKIRIEDKEVFPSQSSDPNLKEKLEEQVKVLGKWMEVSKLDSYALLRKLKSDEWEEEVRRKLREFVSSRRDRQIYPSKLKEEE